MNKLTITFRFGAILIGLQTNKTVPFTIISNLASKCDPLRSGGDLHNIFIKEEKEKRCLLVWFFSRTLL